MSVALNIWGKPEEFWTDDDDSTGDDSSHHVEPAKAVIVSQNLSPAENDDRPEWLIEFERKRNELDDVLEKVPQFKDADLETETAATTGGASSTYVDKPADGRRYMRKKWVIEDKSDISDFHQRLPEAERAIKHEFELDDFQKRAVLHVHADEHVFVCAHTSAGKTVVAEYAIAHAANRGLRAIYTSPIKALSNQKYREFKQIFDSVGIITGDVSVNNEAQCLIMTTEILRTLLYRGDPLMSQLGCVIFDEVHYVNDPDRGVVWEETIIMLHRNVSLVMLSATVPNYLEFADWIGTTKQREVFAIATLYRPTPLKHYLWANDRAYLLMDEKNKFQAGAYSHMYADTRAARKAKELKEQQQAINKKSNLPALGRPGQGRGAAPPVGGPKTKQIQPYRKPGGGDKTQSADARAKTEKLKLQNLLKYLESHNQLPVICFCFSRIKCEQLAAGMPNFDANSQEAKSRVHVFIKQSLAKLPEADQTLPQIQFVTNLVSKGIGIHHGGLLPIVKEMVEILFSRGLVQVLFATETFAMGVNMPARSVVFTAVTKHDGKKVRPLLSAEYTQMAGRAGRRGLDTFGNVYIFTMEDEPPNQQDLTSMMYMKVTALQSKFRLTYRMLLQLLGRRGMRPIDMIAKSFRESVRAQQMPLLKRDIKRRQKDLEDLPAVECIFGEPAIKEYVELEEKSRRVGHSLHLALYNSKFSKEVFCRGRIAILNSLPFVSVPCYGLLLRRCRSSEVSPIGWGGPPMLPSHLSLASAQETEEADDQPVFLDFLILIPRGSSIENPKFFETAKESEEGIKPKILDSGSNHTCQIIFKDAIGPPRDFDMAISMGAAVGPNQYVKAESLVVCTRVPLKLVTSLMNETVSIAPLGAPPAELVTSSQPTELRTPGGDVLISLGHANKERDEDEDETTKVLYTVSEYRMTLFKIAEMLDNTLKNCIEKNSLQVYTLPKRMKHIEVDYFDQCSQQLSLTKSLTANKCHLCPKRSLNFMLETQRRLIVRDIAKLQFGLSDESLGLVPDMEAKINFMQSIGMIDDKLQMTLKGRVAAEITATDEVTLTEVIFENLLEHRPPEVVAAVMSAFVFPERPNAGEEYHAISGELEFLRDEVEKVHRGFEERQRAFYVRTGGEDWWRLCNFNFAPVAFRWAMGLSFKEVLEHTDLQEGTIVRTIMRLDELIRKVKGMAHVLGNKPLEDKMEETSNRIHRDIVFAASLYID